MAETKQRLYYEGKKIEVEHFRDVWDLYGTHQISLLKAAKMLNVSPPTFRKWRLAIFMNQGIDRNLKFLDWGSDDNGTGN